MASLLEKYGWHEWICHSNFSFLTGASHPHELVERADTVGYQSLAVTDMDGVYGIVRAWRAQQKRKKDGVHRRLNLRYGAEVHLEQDHHRPIILQNTVVTLATSKRGYQNLCSLLTHSHRGGKHGAFLSFDDLRISGSRDLVAIFPVRGTLKRDESSRRSFVEKCSQLKSIFGPNFYVALTRTMHPSEDSEVVRTYEFCKKLSVPVLFSQDVFFHERGRKPLSDILHAIRHNTTLERCGSQLFANAERCLHSLSELERLYRGYSFYEDALARSAALSEQFCFDLDELRYQYPKNMIPDGMSAAEYLRKIVWQSAREQYGDPLPDKVFSLLDKELDLIRTLGFEDYFLTVWDIVRWARSQDILCQGRGSAANSAICFVLGITAVDPMRFDLLFERFLSVERGDPPDIDVDFEHERREEVIQYIYSRYGRERAAMVANVITYRTRGSLRAVGLALGIEDGSIANVAKALNQRHMDTSSLSEMITHARTSHSHLYEFWHKMSEELKGFPRHLGIHSGGFVVADEPINTLVPQEPATMVGRTVIQWCKEDIEALNFFKIDILALGMLTALRKSFALIGTHHKDKLTLATIPQDDPETYAMLQRADTVGTFQVESRAQMSMLPRLRPQCFYDLVVEVGIVRPGPIQGGFIHPYLKRRRGEEAITYPHPDLRPILERTKGIPIFQEQIMRMAMVVGDFSPGEADELRRQMGAWQFKGNLSPMIEKLRIGMARKGIAKHFIEQVEQQIHGFAEYGFPESHAASFALLAYASCYIKAHFPAAFTVSLLNSQPMGFYSPHALLQDARRHKIKVLPICARVSTYDTVLEPIPSSGGHDELAIRLGLRLVSGLSEPGARALVAARSSSKKDSSLTEFLHSSLLNRRDLTCLAAADAFRSFGVDRRSALWLSEALPIPDFLDDPTSHEHRLLSESPLERMDEDFRHTGTTLGPHPTTLATSKEYWNYEIPASSAISSQDLAHYPANQTVRIFGMVLVRQAPPSAKGMVFFTLEDEHGFINLAFRPDTYESYRHVANSRGFIFAEGKLQRADGSLSILVSKVFSPYSETADVVDFATSAKSSPTIPPTAAEGIHASWDQIFHQSRNFS